MRVNKYPLTGLKTARENLNMTRPEFKKKFNEFVGEDICTVESLKNWESGRSTPKRIETVIDLCEFLNCDIDYLFGRIDCKTHDSSFIHDYTGLSDEAIENLSFSNHNKRLMNFINYLLTCEKETDKGNVLLLNYIAIRLEILKDNYNLGILSPNEEAGLLFHINTEIYNAVTGYLNEPGGNHNGKHKEN